MTKITNFGVFVGLENGLEGLLHISELADHKVENPEDVVKVGEEIEVKILRVDQDERKIGLSRKRVEWAEEAEAAGRGQAAPRPSPPGRPGQRAQAAACGNSSGPLIQPLPSGDIRRDVRSHLGANRRRRREAGAEPTAVRGTKRRSLRYAASPVVSGGAVFFRLSPEHALHSSHLDNAHASWRNPLARVDSCVWLVCQASRSMVPLPMTKTRRRLPSCRSISAGDLPPRDQRDFAASPDDEQELAIAIGTATSRPATAWSAPICAWW